MDGVDQCCDGPIAAQSVVLFIHGVDIFEAVQGYPATLLIVIIGLHDAVTEESLDPQLHRLLPCVRLLVFLVEVANGGDGYHSDDGGDDPPPRCA